MSELYYINTDQNKKQAGEMVFSLRLLSYLFATKKKCKC